jgi:acetyl esterase
MTSEVAIPDEIRRLMAEIGPKWGRPTPAEHVRQMIDAFTPLLARAPKNGVERTNDIAYGVHPRQVLDVFKPAGAARAPTSPIVMFVHGGAFVDGEKDRTAEIYSNVCIYFARRGVIGINVEFRLAPEFKYPAGAEDMAGAVRWARENAARLGGDPARVFLMAHSAGAAHAGAYAYDKRLHPAGGPGLAGLIVVSGRVRADMHPENPNAKKVEAYYGADPVALEAGSPVNHVRATSVPTFVAMAQYENPLIDVYCAELIHRLAEAKRRAPPMMWLAGHNHTSIVAHFNTAEDALGRALLEFIAATPPAAS